MDKSKFGRRWLLYITIVCLLFFTAIFSHAQLPSSVDETSIAATYNNVAGETGWGLLGAVPFGTGKIKGHASAIAQKSATLLRSKYHAEVGTTFNNWDFNVYTNGLIKKYSGSEAGRVSGVGLSIQFPDFEIAGFVASAGLGVEGSNAGQIGAPNAGDTLEALGYDPETLEKLELYSVNPARTGITIDQRNAFKGVIFGELVHPTGFTISVKGLPEIASDATDNPIHQLIVSGSTSVEVGEQVNVEIGADLGLQTYNDTIESEFATLIAAKLSF